MPFVRPVRPLNPFEQGSGRPRVSQIRWLNSVINYVVLGGRLLGNLRY